jgi:hypothetical protein
VLRLNWRNPINDWHALYIANNRPLGGESIRHEIVDHRLRGAQSTEEPAAGLRSKPALCL